MPPPGAGAPIGVRAAGMGRAFTAVADDASAIYWNPGALASGAFVSLVLDRNDMDQSSGMLLALGAPPVALGYYRTETAGSVEGSDRLVAYHTGITLVQSIGHSLAVGGTVKWVHGSAGGVSTNKFDVDMGVKFTGAAASAGLTVRNVLEPDFTLPGGGLLTLDRQVRAGVALHLFQGTVLAADFDLTKGKTALGEWREMAIGAESHFLPHAWARGGVHWNAAGETLGAAPIGSIGGSYAVYKQILADGQYSFGSSHGDRGWGAGVRIVF